MIETCRFIINEGNKVGAIVKNLSKAFDTLNHSLFIYKLKVYGFDTNALIFIQSHFSNRYQRIKVPGKFSKWQKILIGMCQGFILGLLLFNIFTGNLLFLLLEILHYATMQMTMICIH